MGFSGSLASVFCVVKFVLCVCVGGSEASKHQRTCKIHKVNQRKLEHGFRMTSAAGLPILYIECVRIAMFLASTLGVWEPTLGVCEP